MRPSAFFGNISVALWILLASSTNVLGSEYELELGSGDCEECTDECGCDGCWNGHWLAGSEFTFLKSELRSGGRATLTFNDSDTAGTDVQLLGAQGIDNFNFAPRVFAGRQFNDRWAVVGRYWHLNDWVVDPASPPQGEVNLSNFLTTSNTNMAELYTVDLEGVRSAQFGLLKLDGSVGARYASFKDEASLAAFGVFTPGNFSHIDLSAASQFHGTGVTGSLTGRRQLGDLPLYVFISGRGSSINGTAFSRARVVGTLAVPPNAPLVGAATVTRNDDDARMSIAEFQTGLQWELELQWIPASAFLRSAFEYQHWSIHSLPVGGAGFGGTSDDITVNSFVSANHGEAMLYGYTFATGLTW